MSETTGQGQESPNHRNKRTLKFALRAIIVILACPVFYLFFVPMTTGQSCLDPLGGRVPRKAEDIFLDTLVNGMVEQDFASLSQIANSGALAQLKELAPIATKRYELAFRDDLGGIYEQVIQFDNGVAVYLMFRSTWPCPDFIVTNQEVFERIELIEIRLHEQE